LFLQSCCSIGFLQAGSQAKRALAQVWSVRKLTREKSGRRSARVVLIKVGKEKKD
jgi:hypothetical protein